MKNNNKVQEPFKILINNQPFDWSKQFITGIEVRTLGQITMEYYVYLKVNGQGGDILITDELQTDLSNPGREQFYSKEIGIQLVNIFIDGKKYPITSGKHPVSEIKKLGKVPAAYELEQVIDGKLTPLDDNAIIDIKGEEQFHSHPKDGKSA